MIVFYKINPNIGFSANLDSAASMSDSKWIITLSSDDKMKKNSLSTYDKFINTFDSNEKFAFSSTFEKIDEQGRSVGFIGPNSKLWLDADIDEILSKKIGFNIYKVSSKEMFKRCAISYNNPFNFAATCFQKDNYIEIGGYLGGRIYNPDKWFHWRLLNVVDYVYFLDKPLFEYRWHDNQVSIQSNTKVLRYWIDE